MNLNQLAKSVALAEGGKTQVNIAQIKEVIKCLAIEAYIEPDWIVDVLRLGKKYVEKKRKLAVNGPLLIKQLKKKKSK